VAAAPVGPVGRMPAWAGDVPDEDWDSAIAEISRCCRDGETIALTCHEDPDGDALGSLLAANLYLRRAGCETVASWGTEPFAVPPQYTFLPGLDTLVPPRDFPEEPALLIAFDAASRARLGKLAHVTDAARTVIVVDHHGSSERFGDINIVAPRAAATAVLVDELIRRSGGRPDRDIASCLYTGLVTDTGRFQSRTTDAAAMELGGRLIAEGIEHEQMSRQMFDTHSFGYLKVLARVLDRAAFVPEAAMVWSWLEQADLDRSGVVLEETEGIIDVLRSAEVADVTMILKELEDGSWRVSMRSKGRTDVGALAGDLGGGGHVHSAGFTAHGDREDVVRAVVGHLSHGAADR
jgi:bifunctional oligoribonuclease and PAP phosphatase NrnA